ncbi:MAG: hypothetical protein ACYC6A_16665 [Armatimonadota bacterium]
MQSEQPDRKAHPRGYIEIIVVVVILVIVLAVLYPVIIVRTRPNRQFQCPSNARQLMIAIQMYQQDHGGQFPNKATLWQDIAFPPKSLVCPTYGARNGIGYGYNANLSGLTDKSPGMPALPNLPVLADSRTTDHLLNSTSDIDFRHTGRAIVGFGDGHVALHNPSDITIAPIAKPKSTGGRGNGK